jgi:hypothetical protein
MMAINLDPAAQSLAISSSSDGIPAIATRPIVIAWSIFSSPSEVRLSH